VIFGARRLPSQPRSGGGLNKPDQAGNNAFEQRIKSVLGIEQALFAAHALFPPPACRERVASRSAARRVRGTRACRETAEINTNLSELNLEFPKNRLCCPNVAIAASAIAASAVTRSSRRVPGIGIVRPRSTSHRSGARKSWAEEHHNRAGSMPPQGQNS